MNPIKSINYSVFFEDSSFSQIKEFLNKNRFSKVFVLMDENTRKFCAPILFKKVKILSTAPQIVLAPGERHKNLNSLQFIWKSLSDQSADRGSLLINLGGGMINDIGGFAASTYMRGISFINIPTSLLAMADASVGGKTGIDFLGYKNQIGIFCNPSAVFIQPHFLKTLTEREKKNGFAEILKAALIADKKLWKEISTLAFSETNLKKWIYSSVTIKNNIVLSDFFEKLQRKKLNFGHTVGHALESVYLNKKVSLLHGEAIVIGMICESFISHQMGLLSLKEKKEITDYLKQYVVIKKIPVTYYAQLMRFIIKDKKNTLGSIRMAIPKKIGNCMVDMEVTQEQVLSSFDDFNRFVS